MGEPFATLGGMSLRDELRVVMEAGGTLSQEQARSVLTRILAGEAAEAQIAALLGAMAARGETAAEIAGFAEAMRAAATPMPLTHAERELLVDTCGTGGDGSGTFNISTAAALVAVAAGATVAKHGNRAVTSSSGSADVLEALGVPIDLAPAAAAESLRRHRFAFFHAPALHPAMRAVMPVRRALGVRTIFNVVGPLTNPAGAARQVMGVYAAKLLPRVAEAMMLLGVRRALVVHGSGASDRVQASDGSVPGPGIDELSLAGPSRLTEVRGASALESVVTPEQFGFSRAPLEALRGGDATANAAILLSIFSGEPGPRREVVLLNAAAVLTVAELAPDLAAGIERSKEAIDSGAVRRLLQQLSA